MPLKRTRYKPYYRRDGATLYNGDCLKILPTLDPVDTVITGPPYGLRFMGASWDHEVPGPVYWSAVRAACKPGAVMLVFGHPRTFGDLWNAIKEAGWLIRDCIMWLHGEGFPKSYNISKGIDKSLGAKRPVVGTGRAGAAFHYGNPGEGGFGTLSHLPDGYASKEWEITGPATEQAREWDGYGTALKPAWEPIIVAMNVLDGTFVNNALTHGVAGFNIEGGRVETTDNLNGGAYADAGCERYDGSKNWRYSHGGAGAYTQPSGRWPANVVLDDVAGRILDRSQEDVYKWWSDDLPEGPSRFFYNPRASRADKGDYNDHPTVHHTALLRYLCKITRTPNRGVVLDPFAGSGTTVLAAAQTFRDAIGIEIEPHYCEIAEQRLRERAPRRLKKVLKVKVA